MSSSSASLLISGLLNFSNFRGCVVIFHCGFICISLIINGVENFFMCLLLLIYHLLWYTVHPNLFPTFLLDSYLLFKKYFFRTYSRFKFFVRHLNDECFLLVCGLPFISLVSFQVEVLNFDEAQFIYFSFLKFVLLCILRSLCTPKSHRIFCYSTRQHIKNRNITLLTKVCIVKAMVLPAVMCGCESWTIKKAER